MRYAALGLLGLGLLTFSEGPPAPGARAAKGANRDANNGRSGAEKGARHFNALSRIGVMLVELSPEMSDGAGADGSALFWSGHEITVSQFRLFVEETDYQTDAETGAGGFGVDAESGVISWGSEYNWRNIGAMQRDDFPVLNVSTRDARTFCRWLSEKEGKAFRLPNEDDCRLFSSLKTSASGISLADGTDLFWHEQVLALHPAFRSFREFLGSDVGPGELPVGLAARFQAPLLVRSVLRGWNLVGDPAGAYGFRVVREK